MAMIAECSPDSPVREPDWRYRRARHLDAGRIDYRPRREDAWVRLILSRLQSRKVRGLEARRRVAALAEAHRIRYEADHYVHMEIEARLLAGQDDDQIGGRLCLEPGVIEAYERAHFNVRDVLDKLDYIMFCVIGPTVYTGIRPGDVGTLMKLFAYGRGAFVLDALLYHLGWPGAPHPAGIEPEDMVELGHRLDLLIALRTLQIGDKDALPLMRLNRRLGEIQRRWASRDHATVMRAVAPTLSLPSGRQSPGEPVSPVLVPLDGDLREVRNDTNALLGPIDLHVAVPGAIRRTG
jgi:hypothetical protein